MEDRYNIEVATQKEDKGRTMYLNWLSTKPECIHEQFSTDHWSSWDAKFWSGGTLCLAEIKARNYDVNYLTKAGAEIDFKKAQEVYHLAMNLKAMPLVMTFTKDNWLILSDLRKARNKDVSMQYRQTNDNNHQKALKPTLNLINCTI